MAYRARNGKWYPRKESKREYCSRKDREYANDVPHTGNVILGGAVLIILFMILF